MAGSAVRGLRLRAVRPTRDRPIGGISSGRVGGSDRRGPGLGRAGGAGGRARGIGARASVARAAAGAADARRCTVPGARPTRSSTTARRESRWSNSLAWSRGRDCRSSSGAILAHDPALDRAIAIVRATAGGGGSIAARRMADHGRGRDPARRACRRGGQAFGLGLRFGSGAGGG